METNNNNQAKENLLKRAAESKKELWQKFKEGQLVKNKKTIEYSNSIGIKEITFEEAPRRLLGGHYWNGFKLCRYKVNAFRPNSPFNYFSRYKIEPIYETYEPRSFLFILHDLVHTSSGKT